MKKAQSQIVVIGGGAGGLEFVTRLGRSLGRSKRAKITLVDQSPTHVWKPLLHEVAAGTLDSHEDELNYLVHASRNHYQFQLGSLSGLNREKRHIILAPVYDNGIEIIPQRELAYDYLVIAIGSVCNDFNTPGAKQHCYFLDSRQQADKFQQHLLNSTLHAQYQNDSLKPGQLDVAIVGGGATGVELAAQLHFSFNQAVAYGLDRIDPKHDAKISLIEASERILPHLPARFSQGIQRELEKMNVQVICNEKVTHMTDQGLSTDADRFIPAKTIVWAAGIKAPDVLADLDGLEATRSNQLVVKQNLQTSLDEHIFAFGDCAYCPQPGSDRPVPPRAQSAHQQASLLAKSLSGYLQGKPLRDYVYRDYGSLVSLSRNNALGRLMGRITGSVMIEGKLARLVYVSLYKSHQGVVSGYWHTTLKAIAGYLTRRIKPQLKLH